MGEPSGIFVLEEELTGILDDTEKKISEFQAFFPDNSFWKVAGIKIYGFKSIEKCPLVLEILFKVKREKDSFITGFDLKSVIADFLRTLQELQAVFDNIKWEMEGDTLTIFHETMDDGEYKKESIVLKRL